METIARPCRPEDWSPPRVLLVGMGMGRADLSSHALQWIRAAEVLFGGRRHLESFPDHAGKKIPLGKSLDESLAELDALSRRSRTAVLASGDPLYYGIGRRMFGALGRDRIHVIPNMTAVQALFARIGAPWEDVRVISLHGRDGSEGEQDWRSAVREGATVALFTDQRRTPAWVARRLIEEEIPGCGLIVGEDLGLDTERVRRFAPAEALNCDFSALNLCVVVPAEGPERPGGESANLTGEKPPVFGMEESALAHEAGLITKLEVRAVALAHLQLQKGLVLWDIGAGSGSISIEASRIAALQRVIALEKNVDRFQQLVENIAKFGGRRIEPLCGNAVELLAQLPEPHRVFIGGSGGDLRGILEQVAARLLPGGRVVQTAVTLDTFEQMRTFWQGRGWKLNLLQLQVNRSAPIGGSHRFEALNPVFVVTAVHPESSSMGER